MERQEKMDYAAVVREYRTNGGGLKMKEWCQQEGYDYFKVRRYSKKEPMFPGLETNAAVAAGTPKPPKLINLEMTVDSDSPSALSGGESEKSGNFVPVNEQSLIAVLQAKVAQLTVELADAERKNNSAEAIARMEEFYRKQREDDKAYYEQRLESERQQHREEVEALRQDIRELKQQQRDEMRHFREDSKRQMQMLNERLAVLSNLAKARELTAEEQKALARFRQSQKYKRSAEQRNLLNRRP